MIMRTTCVLHIDVYIAQSFLISKLTPCSGLSIICWMGECLYSGDKEKEKLDKMRAKRILSSVRAKFWPRQYRGPTPKGMNACGCAHEPLTPLANLWGLNSRASGPHIWGSWCSFVTVTQVWKPLGTWMSPNRKSCSASLASCGAGGYRRNDSWSTIVSCVILEKQCCETLYCNHIYSLISYHVTM